MFFFSVGATVEALIAWAVSTLGVKALLVVSALPAVLAAVAVILWLPESPRYLLLRGRPKRACALLERIARHNGTASHGATLQLLRRLQDAAAAAAATAAATTGTTHEPPPGSHSAEALNKLEYTDQTLVEKVGSATDNFASIAPPVTPAQASERQPAPAPAPTPSAMTARGAKSSVWRVLAGYAHTLQSHVLSDAQLLRKVLIFSTEFLLMAFVYYFLVLFTVKHKVEQDVSLSASSYVSVAISNLAEIPGLLLAMRLLDSIGRINTISTMFFVCALCTLLLALAPTAPVAPEAASREEVELGKDDGGGGSHGRQEREREGGGGGGGAFSLDVMLQEALVFVMRASALGFNQSLWIFTTESFPTSVRASSLGFTTSFARVGGALSPLVLDHLYTASPSMVMVLVAGVAVAAGCLIRMVGLVCLC